MLSHSESYVPHNKLCKKILERNDGADPVWLCIRDL